MQSLLCKKVLYRRRGIDLQSLFYMFCLYLALFGLNIHSNVQCYKLDTSITNDNKSSNASDSHPLVKDDHHLNTNNYNNDNIKNSKNNIYINNHNIANHSDEKASRYINKDKKLISPINNTTSIGKYSKVTNSSKSTFLPNKTNSNSIKLNSNNESHANNDGSDGGDSHSNRPKNPIGQVPGFKKQQSVMKMHKMVPKEETIIDESTMSAAGNASMSCGDRKFRCADGTCIHITFVCDGEAECKDKSDEDPKECKISDKNCTDTQFRCKNGRCIPKRWKCDGEQDCNDGSDENPEVCQSNVCTAEQFTCRGGSGQCIPLSWMCDRTPDCQDGSDEELCNETCRPNEFTCGNGRCIQKRWVCDNDNDCGDHSDEKNCAPTKCDPKLQFACSDQVCIPRKWQCDGENDCADASDEKDCSQTAPTSFLTCRSTEFQCNDRVTCINKRWLCDGEKDCPGGEDESASLPSCTNITCRPDQFQCKDRTCIAGIFECSGKPECADGSDELNCTIVATKDRQCNLKKEFDCGGGVCIPLSKVCDKKPDCPNFADEPSNKCYNSECKVNNGGCSDICVDTAAGYYCDCKPGYQLVDGKQCVDVNECENLDACSQKCINTEGSFKCECYDGYMRDHRNHTRCKATEGHASLLFARRHDIRKISLDHREMTAIVNETKSATALDYVFRTGMIVWSDVAEQKIYKAPIDEGNEKTVILKDQLVTSDGLAVDWIYNHIYFTDTKKCSIELVNFEGSMTKVLITDELRIPRAIALDPLSGWMYWTDWGDEPKIERAGMDGTHRTAIVTRDVKWPNGLTLDLVKERVYWVDAKLNMISSCNYDGSKRSVILYSIDSLRHPFSITTFEDWLYWTDWDKETIFRANKFNGGDVEPVAALHMAQHPMTIHVYHPYRQPDGVNYCLAVNGHCSHLCLPAPQINSRSPKITCACPTGLRLTNEGLMCEEEEPADDNGSVIGVLMTGGDMVLQAVEQRPTSVPSDDAGDDVGWSGGITATASAITQKGGNSGSFGMPPMEMPVAGITSKVYHQVLCELYLNYTGSMSSSMTELPMPDEQVAVTTSSSTTTGTEGTTAMSVNIEPLMDSSGRDQGYFAYNHHVIGDGADTFAFVPVTPHPFSDMHAGDTLINKEPKDGTGNLQMTQMDELTNGYKPGASSNGNSYWNSSPKYSFLNKFKPEDKGEGGSMTESQTEMDEFLQLFHTSEKRVKWLCNKWQASWPKGNNGTATGKDSSSGTGDSSRTRREDSDKGFIALIVIVILILFSLVLAPVGYCIYKKCEHRNLTSMNFDNPVYRKTTEDTFQIEKNSLHPTNLHPTTIGEEAQQPLNPARHE